MAEEEQLCWTKAVNSALEAAVPVREPAIIYHAMRYSLLPQQISTKNKQTDIHAQLQSPELRLHSTLCIGACFLFCSDAEFNPASPSLLPTACAMEMLHAASLIHDDLPCMDDDDLRFGLPSNHIVFGQDMAILAGDALYALAVQHVATQSRGIDAARLLRVIAELSKAVGSQGMVAGQFLDLTQIQARNPIEAAAPANCTDPTVSDCNGNPCGTSNSTDGNCGPNSLTVDLDGLQAVHLRKTAMLMECSAMCGAILGGATDDQIENVRQYARALGLLCHAVTDIIKHNDTKSESGRVSYPGLLGLEKSMELVQKLKLNAKYALRHFDENKSEPLLSLVDMVISKVNAGANA